MSTSFSDILKSIKRAVPVAASTPNHPEAKLRELVSPLWDDYIRSKRINLNFSPRDERQLANGRADTVFNRLILEYKKPGVIQSNNEKNRKLIAQVKGYIEDLAKEERWKEERLLGVAFDGTYFLFVRKVGRWIEEEPLPVSVENIERFLLTLEKLTTKAALVPENLIRDFGVGAGSLNYVASNAIKAFYFALTKNVNQRVRVFFAQWALQFAEVHGAIENKKFDVETLFKSYETRDILKKLYQFLVPKQIRHDLGEYYTPDWLAARCLNQVGYGVKEHDLLHKRVLDPGCGSGTFLILAIKRAKEHAQLKGTDPAETLNQITKNIVGFDLNPLAVISARTNYLLAVADLLKHKKDDVTIPIYLCDSINPPQARVAGEMTLFEEKLPYEVKTAVGNFYFPHEVVTRQGIQTLANLMEDGIKRGQSTDAFLRKAKSDLRLPKDDFEKTDSVLIAVYEKLGELEEKGINGIWARIIKNAFAPLFVGQFDLIVGNPPWVNWEALPQEYRDKTVDIWRKYDLFEHAGLRARLGSAKDDISVLMTYVSIDKYLKDKGRLCIVITQTLFKTVGGGEGFRRFRLGKNGTPFKVLQVDDMTALQPFDSATNRTAVFLSQKGNETSYPVEYHIWKKREKGPIAIDLEWEEVQQKTITRRLKAQSIDGSVQGSWITARAKALKALTNVVGEAAYQAREGTNTGGANGVLWVEVKKSDGDVCIIENLNEIGKKEIAAYRAEVDADLIFPLLRGRDIQRWNANPSIQILIPQDLNDPAKAIDKKMIEKKYPKTHNFLKYFEQDLRNRALYKKYLEPQGVPFYGIYNIGLYTFAPYKVVWKEQSSVFECAVVSSFDGKVVVPDHKSMLVPFQSEDEAHYVCALLASTITSFIVQAYTISTQQSTHILDNIKIPKYDAESETHRDLSHLSKQCHEKVAAGISATDLEEQIDELAAELWGMSNDELKEIQQSLEEMK